MSIPSTTFFIDGPCEDPAYLNTRDHPRGVESKHFVEELWRRFYHLADSHFARMRELIFISDSGRCTSLLPCLSMILT